MQAVHHLGLGHRVHQTLGVAVPCAHDEDGLQAAQVPCVADGVEFHADVLVRRFATLVDSPELLRVLLSPRDRLAQRVLGFLPFALFAALGVRHDKSHEEEVVVEVGLVRGKYIADAGAETENFWKVSALAFH
jgi:hypothetical protein